MGKVKFQLSSKQLDVGGNPGSLDPAFLNSSAAGSVHNRYINVHAGDAHFAPLPQPEIVLDKSLSAAAQASAVWAESAFRLQEAEAQARADQLVLDYGSHAESLLMGNEKTKGYLQLVGQEANDAYPTIAESLNKTARQYLDNADPNVQSKAMLRLNQVNKSAISKAATHKVSQFHAWQADIEKGKREALKRDIFKKSMDPVETGLAIVAAVEEMRVRLANNPDQADAEELAMMTELFDDLIVTHTKTGHFDLANAYIEMGEGMGADPRMLAVRQDQWATAIDSHVANEEAAANRSHTAQVRLDKEQAIELGNKANITGDPRWLEGIRDPIHRASYMRAYQDIKAGVASTPEALLLLAEDRAELALDPFRLLNPNYIVGLSYEDRVNAINTLNKENKSGLSAHLTASEEWIKTIVPASLDAWQREFFNQEAQSTMLRINERIRNVANQAVAKGEDPFVAIRKEQVAILKDPYFLTEFSQLKVMEDDISAIPVLSKERIGGVYGGLMGKVFGEAEPIETQRTKLEEAYEDASLALLEAYDVPFQADGITPDMGAFDVMIANNPLRRQEYYEHLRMLTMQRRYHEGLIQDNIDNLNIGTIK